MTTNNWNDFNDAESQQSGFDLIPKGTIVPVRMTIKPGGYDDPSQGWGGGYATNHQQVCSALTPALSRSCSPRPVGPLRNSHEQKFQSGPML